MTTRDSSPIRPADLRLIALLELTKGLLVLLAGFGLLSQLHQDTALAAEELVRHLHLNPASHTPRIFIEAASGLTDARLWTLAGAAMGYSLLRFAEAYGLWREKAWAEWFGALSGALYLPLELYELYQRITWARVTVLAVNVVVVAVLVRALLKRRKSRGGQG
ncbi:MAG TPA: DUF2127 domain-containing protein [Humidesulfovibrio sp.]|uniref:DUF2127 domain-containing protein n=1 Tax=Humidesulfovibrio sp. TaxID=2910988 RepID=UPI002CDA61E6|nr:DUF2127 domain-containing protein [Humidesulfovibrio sp.]HWR03032.1 DUF2127 domain-containing protein [Humidesulfovibrio sp.]